MRTRNEAATDARCWDLNSESGRLVVVSFCLETRAIGWIWRSRWCESPETCVRHQILRSRGLRPGSIKEGIVSQTLCSVVQPVSRLGTIDLVAAADELECGSGHQGDANHLRQTHSMRFCSKAFENAFRGK